MTPRKCHYPFDGPWTCDSGARSEVHLHVECQAPGFKRLISMKSTIECCATHQDAAKRYLLGPVNREKMTTWLMEHQGLPEPNWITARVEYPSIQVPVEEIIARCDRHGCKRKAVYRVRIAVPAMGNKLKVMESPTDMYVCEEHRLNTKAKHITDDDDMRKALYEGLQQAGMVLPNLDKALVRFEPIGS